MTEIREQFNKVIEYSQSGIVEPKTETLFKIWEQKKGKIIEAFGGKLIYEVPEKIICELSEEAKQERINSFVSYIWDLGYDDLGRFLDRQKEGFYDNRVIKDFTACDEKCTIIKKNSKLVKAFKYFVDNENVLNTLQSKASQLIQENKIEGTLCFSVHPLDYLSISENTYNWRSCHALDGEYRAGNLSYMVDSSTIVCYLKGADNVKLPHFPESVPWNSKKWRVLLYLSNDWRMVFAGKQYPFASEPHMKKVLEFLNVKFKKVKDSFWRNRESTFWTDWTTYSKSKLKNPELDLNFYFEQDYIPLSDALVSLYTLVTDQPASKHFNDVLKSSCYKPMYSYAAYKEPWDDRIRLYACEYNTKFEIGGPTYCLRCGKEEVMDSSGTMMCYDCELNYGTSENDAFCFCAACGRRIVVEDGYLVGDEFYCEECYNKEAKRCVECGECYLADEMIHDENTDTYTCNWCYNN